MISERTTQAETKYEDNLKLAIGIVEKYGYGKYVQVLADYWAENPPTAGHGFAHAVSVGVEAFIIGKVNNFPNPEYLFLGGLFHDIFRPAEGEHGEEDQTPGAAVVEKIFTENNLDRLAMEHIVGAIKTHDSWRKEDNPPAFDLYLSLGDKSMMDTLLADSYVWINNRKRQLEGKSPVYSSHLETLSSFYKYQLRAWEILMKYRYVKGLEKPREAYVETVRMTIAKYQEDPSGEHFNEWMEHQKNRMQSLEIKFLEAFGVQHEKIDKILSLYRI